MKKVLNSCTMCAECCMCAIVVIPSFSVSK